MTAAGERFPHCLAGATASGKSAVVHALAKATGRAVLSADAMLVYRGMDIGTAKPTPAERAECPYFGLDCVDPDTDFSAGRWLEAASAAPDGALVTGGTGLYFSVLLRGLDPAPPADPERRAALEALPAETLSARLAARGVTLPDMRNPRRLVRALEILEAGLPLPRGWTETARPVLHALRWPRAALHARIASRVRQMYADGLLEETAALAERWPVWSRTAAQAIGYAEALGVLRGTLTLSEAQERTVIRTRQLAKRQETYLRGQFDVRWIDCSPGDTVDTLAARVADAWHL